MQSIEELKAWWDENTDAFKPEEPKTGAGKAAKASKKENKSAKKRKHAARSSDVLEGCDGGQSPGCCSETPLSVATGSSRPMRAAAQECSRNVQRVLRAEQELPAKKLKALWTHDLPGTF